MEFKVAVIGGGPAGLMAAGRAAELGAKIVLLEKNDNLGKKLLITGNGRCNLTNFELNDRILIEQFGKNGRFLFSALNKFGVERTLKFFNELGVATKIESGNRVFPVSDNAGEVLKTLVNYLRENNVTILKNATVNRLLRKDKNIEAVILAGDKKIAAERYIIATGGLSYPATGSTGDGYRWAETLGHTVITPRPALLPVLVKEAWVKELEGLSLRNVNISIRQNDKKVAEQLGDVLFTAVGLSGPTVLNLSKKIGDILDAGTVELQIDLQPTLTYPALDDLLLRDFNQNQNRMLKNSLMDLAPRRMIPIIIKLSEINPDQRLNSISKMERKKLLHLLKEFTLQVKRLEHIRQAIITCGGIALNEIDSKTMRSKLIGNLYFCGEILDLDGPTGGYNLQECWSTGYTAGESAAASTL